MFGNFVIRRELNERWGARLDNDPKQIMRGVRIMGKICAENSPFHDYREMSHVAKIEKT